MAFLAISVTSGLSADSPKPLASPTPPPATVKTNRLAAKDLVLPGRGLAQHPFLYSGEWDTRKTHQTMFLVKGGKVAWTYEISRKDEKNGQESEFSDMHLPVQQWAESKKVDGRVATRKPKNTRSGDMHGKSDHQRSDASLDNQSKQDHYPESEQRCRIDDGIGICDARCRDQRQNYGNELAHGEAG